MSIQVRGLTHIYAPGMPDEHVALQDIDLDLWDGEIVAVIGHTGSGKSTLLQHLNGLLRASGGTICVDGLELGAPGVSMREIRRRVGLVFQYPEYQLFEETVEKDVSFGPKNLGLSADEIAERVQEALALVGLADPTVRTRSPFALSGGQKRRVAIAGVLAMRPRVLILDEPTAGLDPGAHRDMLRMIRQVHEAQGNTTVFVSHNMADVASLADRVLVLDAGRLVLSGTPQEVFSQGERLQALGLNVPPVTALTGQLRAAGLPVADALSPEEAVSHIMRAVQGDGAQ